MAPQPARIGRYEVASRLGEGGMGVVYLARDPQLERMVAIKMLAGETAAALDPEVRRRFAREAQSAAALRHAHIVTIYDVGEEAGQPFIAMEFLDGESMADLIRRRAPLDPSRKLGLILDLCAGLSYAHERGLIHRDIKPANLVITSEGTLKILDFGLARSAAATGQVALTMAGTIMGTPNYMSPEQVAGKTLDQRSDIFSVGAVLYELLTYQGAFAADTPLLVLHAILNNQPPPLRDGAPGIDPALEPIVARAMEKDRERRYESLRALAADLSRVRDRSSRALDAPTVLLPIPAAPEPTTRPADTIATSSLDRPATTRRPLWLGGAAAAIAALAVLGFVLVSNAGTSDSDKGGIVPTASPTVPPPPAPPPAAPPAAASVEQTPGAANAAPAPPPKPGPDRSAARDGSARGPDAPASPTTTSRTDPRDAARCTALLEKLSLGLEPLTAEEKRFRLEKCRN